MAHYTEAVTLAREATDAEAHFTLGRSLNNLALLHERRGEDAEALRLLLEASDVARRARDVQHISFSNWRLGFYHYLQGDWRTAKRYALENLQMPLSPINRQETEHLLRVLEGDLETAASLARGLLEHHRRSGELQGVFGWNAGLAFLYLELGRTQEAHEAAAEAAGIAESLAFFNPFVAEALARGGDYERCETYCARGEALSRAWRNPRGMAPVLRGRAILALERGDPDGAVRLLDESLPLAKQIGLLPHAYVLHTLAEALTRRGNRGDIERAKGVLQECLTLLEQMGFTRKAEQVRAQLAALN
jgi:tetratricopeptide (TPR) repeat protein